MEDPTDFIAPILDRVKADYIQRKYEVSDWVDPVDFLTKLAIKSGRLGKGGEPDLNSVAVNIINDWQRGKLPYFVAPPREEGDNEADEDNEDGVNESDEPMAGTVEEDDSEEEAEVSGHERFSEMLERLYSMHILVLICRL